MENKVEERGGWGSKFGFLMAAAGSAIGLGNLWKFPYLAAKFGGGLFVVVYLAIVVLLGFTMMLGELTIGRSTRLEQYSAYRKLNKKWGFLGALGVLSAFMILSFYSVVGGWVLKYIFTFLTGGVKGDPGAFFGTFSGSVGEPIFWHALFMIATLLIVLGGISGGIEKASKIMMPLLFLFLIILVVRVLTLPGAGAGVAYYLKPNFANFSLDVVVKAMGQVFFSLSLGMGTLVTYGSYLNGTEDLQENALTIPALDTLAALLAGLAIVPAVVAFGMDLDAGPKLLFITLPKIFDSMPLGGIFGLMFFVLVFFAAVTSSISLLEVPVAWVVDSKGWTRKKAVFFFATVCWVIGIGASLSLGVWDMKFLPNMGLFDTLDYLTSNIMLPLGGLLMSLFYTFAWGYEAPIAEIKKGSTFSLQSFWKLSMMVLVPIMMAVLFLTQMGILKL
ncbi:MAG: sodium-dependent transporter [Clostridiaceae bacterium]